MKAVLFCCMFIIAALTGACQQNDSVVFKMDTINIRGIVFGYDGKPAKNMEIGVHGLITPNCPVLIKTDTAGCFQFSGVSPQDKLYILDGRYSYTYFPVKGSRYIVIYLPQPKITELNPQDSIFVKARRTHPKNQPSFRYLKQLVFDGLDSQYPPQPVGRVVDYIRKNLTYPEKAIANNIEGTVEVAFKITKDGSLNDIIVVKGIGYGCDEEVVHLIKTSPAWHPGIWDGRPLETLESVSIKFVLTDN